MPIVEFETAEKFIEKMKEKFLAEKDKGRSDRFELIIATGNRRAVLLPTVTTQRVNSLLFRGMDDVDADRILKAGKDIEVKVTKCLNFWFDERKEPIVWPPKRKTEPSI